MDYRNIRRWKELKFDLPFLVLMSFILWYMAHSEHITDRAVFFIAFLIPTFICLFRVYSTFKGKDMSTGNCLEEINSVIGKKGDSKILHKMDHAEFIHHEDGTVSGRGKTEI